MLPPAKQRISRSCVCQQPCVWTHSGLAVRLEHPLKSCQRSSVRTLGGRRLTKKTAIRWRMDNRDQSKSQLSMIQVCPSLSIETSSVSSLRHMLGYSRKGTGRTEWPWCFLNEAWTATVRLKKMSLPGWTLIGIRQSNQPGSPMLSFEQFEEYALHHERYFFSLQSLWVGLGEWWCSTLWLSLILSIVESLFAIDGVSLLV